MCLCVRKEGKGMLEQGQAAPVFRQLQTGSKYTLPLLQNQSTRLIPPSVPHPTHPSPHLWSTALWSENIKPVAASTVSQSHWLTSSSPNHPSDLLPVSLWTWIGGGG